MVSSNIRPRFISSFKLTTPQSTSNGQPKKEQNTPTFRWNRKKKAIIAVSLVIVVLVSCFALYPHGNPALSDDPDPTATASGSPTPSASTSTQTTQPSNGPQDSTPPIHPTSPPNSDTSWQVVTHANPVNADTWRAVAKYAWNYFDVDVGVDSTTGLPGSSGSFSAFTDWDLGVYIQAVIDAKTIGIIGADGDWGSGARLEKVMTFLETRELNSTTGYPFWFYKSDGTNYHENSDKATGPDTMDTGRLFVALNNLKSFNSSLAPRIDNLVYNVNENRSNYVTLVPSMKSFQGSTSIYGYYMVSGFASFWPNELSAVPPKIINNILNSDTISYGNVTLPASQLLGDPLYGSLFDIKNNPVGLETIAQKVYAAHETYYNLTNMYRAFSEGPSLSGDWAYEWVVDYDRTWVVNVNNQDSTMTPIIYTKTAFCFLSIYNTTFAKSMVSYLEVAQDAPNRGYYSGVDENGNKLPDTSLHTNGLILGAARYAIQHV